MRGPGSTYVPVLSLRGLIIAMVLSLLFIILLRFLAGIMVWVMIVMVILVLGYGKSLPPCVLHSPLYCSYPLKSRPEEELDCGLRRCPCCSPAGSVLASARVCRGTDRPPGDTAGAAPHLEGRGSATRGFPSVLSKAQASLSEPPRWGAQAGIPNSSKLPADFNWRFCPRQDCSARPVAF